MRPISHYRSALRETFGHRGYRIRHDGTIEAYGTMPNTTSTGWYLYGDLGHQETEYRLFGEEQA